MEEQGGADRDHTPSLGRNFYKVIQLGNVTVYNGTGANCSKTQQGGQAWQSRPCPGLSSHEYACTSSCSEVPRNSDAGEFQDEWVEVVSIKLAAPASSMSVGIRAAVDSNDIFEVLWNTSLPMGRDAWQFESGIDPTTSQVVAVHEAILNATQTLLHCTCDSEQLSSS